MTDMQHIQNVLRYVDKNGGAEDRDGVTDNCLYRRLMASGSTLARAAIERAEMLAGRKVDRTVVNSGAHSHDGGQTWHSHKG